MSLEYRIEAFGKISLSSFSFENNFHSNEDELKEYIKEHLNSYCGVRLVKISNAEELEVKIAELTRELENANATIKELEKHKAIIDAVGRALNIFEGIRNPGDEYDKEYDDLDDY